MFSVDLEPTGILRIEVSGSLSRASAETLLMDVQQIVPRARRQNGGSLRSIGAAKSMPVQMALVLDYLVKRAKLVFAEPDDRAGLVVDSALVRLQMARILPREQLVCSPTKPRRAIGCGLSDRRAGVAGYAPIVYMTIWMVRSEKMEAVSLADAKTRLSELIARVEAGETVSITKRGKPVARLVAETPARKPIDFEPMRRIAATMPYQEESAGDFFARVRAADML